MKLNKIAALPKAKTCVRSYVRTLRHEPGQAISDYDPQSIMRTFGMTKEQVESTFGKAKTRGDLRALLVAQFPELKADGEYK